MKNTSKVSKKSTDYVLVKGAVVILLILIMLLPTPFIINLIGERKERKEKVVKEESQRFGGNQTLCGPFIKLPYEKKDSLGRLTLHYKYISPQNLKVKGNLIPLPKHRGLYDMVMYKTQLIIDANFDSTIYNRLQKDNKNYHWNEAEIILGISETKGWEGDLNFNVNKANIPAEPGNIFSVEELVKFKDQVEYNTREMEELKVPISWEPDKKISVSIPVLLNGAGELNIIPVSKMMEIDLTTPCKDLKFTGDASPVENTV